jgi:hypothetical protein
LWNACESKQLAGDWKKVETVWKRLLENAALGMSIRCAMFRHGEGDGVMMLRGANTYFGRTKELVQTLRPTLHIEAVVASISGILAFGIFRRSKIAVVLMLILVIVPQLYTWLVAHSFAGTIVSVFVAGFLLRGAGRIFERPEENDVSSIPKRCNCGCWDGHDRLHRWRAAAARLRKSRCGVRLTPKDEAQDKTDSERREYRLRRVFAHVLLRIFLDCPDAILRIIPRLLGLAARYSPASAPAADFKFSGRLTGARSGAFQFRPSLFYFILFRHCYISQVISTLPK